MNQLIRSFWGLGFLGVVGCAAGAGGSRTPAAAVAPAPRIQAAHAVAAKPQGAVASAPPEYHDQSESDRVFARAVQRSREQIEDLQAAIVFVRSGAQTRAFRQQ